MEWLVILTGVCLGSFLSLVSYRLPHGGKMAMARSQCPVCHTTLTPRDLVPVFSWLVHRGRCRHCQAPISWRYPAIELVTAAGLLAVYMSYGVSPQAVLLMVMTLALLVMMIVDFEHYIIPDEVQMTLALLAVAYHGLLGTHPAEPLAGALLGALIGWGLQTGYHRLRKRDGLGTGDVKFLAVAGLWLGAINLIPLLFFSGVLGVLTATLWQWLRRGALFPFGPALALSLWICVLWPRVPFFFFHWPALFLE